MRKVRVKNDDSAFGEMLSAHCVRVEARFAHVVSRCARRGTVECLLPAISIACCTMLIN